MPRGLEPDAALWLTAWVCMPRGTLRANSLPSRLGVPTQQATQQQLQSFGGKRLPWHCIRLCGTLQTIKQNTLPMLPPACWDRQQPSQP